MSPEAERPSVTLIAPELGLPDQAFFHTARPSNRMGMQRFNTERSTRSSHFLRAVPPNSGAEKRWDSGNSSARLRRHVRKVENKCGLSRYGKLKGSRQWESGSLGVRMRRTK